jgi:SAM-dependent methyltransferase
MDRSAGGVVEWYERKTESILSKYGPGPRVHFHTGMIDPDAEPEPTLEGLRRQLVQSQERLLREASTFWCAHGSLGGLVLDVGCGLGGSAIFLAQEHGATVHALTNVPGHVRYIEGFAAEAGVNDRVRVILGDACNIPGTSTYDASVAVESSCYLDRGAWFRNLAGRLRYSGHVFIADTFTDLDEVRKPFDRYWLTRIGGMEEYIDAAAMSGFELEAKLDVTSMTSRFWEFSSLYSSSLLRDQHLSGDESRRLGRSIRWQRRLMGMWGSGKLTCALLSFRLE